jgi:hypothetical protein
MEIGNPVGNTHLSRSRRTQDITASHSADTNSNWKQGLQSMPGTNMVRNHEVEPKRNGASLSQ